MERFKSDKLHPLLTEIFRGYPVLPMDVLGIYVLLPDHAKS